MNRKLERYGTPDTGALSGNSQNVEGKGKDPLAALKAEEASRMQRHAAEQGNIDLDARAEDAASQLHHVKSAAREAWGISADSLARGPSLDALQEKSMREHRMPFKSADDMRRAAQQEKPGMARRALNFLLGRSDASLENEKKDEAA